MMEEDVVPITAPRGLMWADNGLEIYPPFMVGRL